MSAAYSPRILGLILARGGSKRLPGKNLRPLLGKPLVAWSVEAALACPAIARTVVSTDSQEIADAALAAGAEVPFLRPVPLAQDRSTSADAALHAMDFLEQAGDRFDAVILLEPTSPLRARGDLPAVAQLLTQRWDDCDAVVSVGKVQLEQPEVMKALGADGLLSPWLASDGAPAEKPVAVEKPAATASAEVLKRVESWADDWSRKDVKGYLSHYARDFKTPGGVSRADWESERQLRIRKPGAIRVSIENPKVIMDGSDGATVHFRQRYISASLKSGSSKTLVLIKREGKWLIQQERIGN